MGFYCLLIEDEVMMPGLFLSIALQATPIVAPTTATPRTAEESAVLAKIDRVFAALEAGDGQALLEHVGCGVHEPGVDIPKLLECKQVRRVFGAFELVARRLIDGNGAASRGGVGTVTGVELAGGKAKFAGGVGHSVFGDTLNRARRGTKKKGAPQDGRASWWEGSSSLQFARRNGPHHPEKGCSVRKPGDHLRQPRLASP